MAQTEAKKPSRIFWIAFMGGAAMLAAYFYGEEPQSGSGGAPKRRNPVASSSNQSDFLPEDYTADFQPVNEPLKNAFKPLVVRKGGMLSTPAMSNAIPPALAGGESGWEFTGIAEVNGRRQALIENLQTGVGEFLTAGQRWKTSNVLTITNDSVVLKGVDSDAVRTVSLPNLESEDFSGEGGLAPLPLPMTGRIGNIAIEPVPAAVAESRNNNADRNARSTRTEATEVNDEN